jgi:hypothetical protein
MKNKLICLIVLIFLTDNACCAKMNPFITNDCNSDTIKYSGNFSCHDLPDIYYKSNGITISSDYIIEDSLNIDLNKDGLKDKLLVLTPQYLIPFSSNCELEKLEDIDCYRILVEIINNNRKYKVRNCYYNLISGFGGTLSAYTGIYETTNGFKITHGMGARYYLEYSMFFTTSKHEITLEKISKLCSFSGNDTLINYNYKGVQLQSINIRDTLKQNCNCDIFWKKLEAQVQ